MNFAKRTRPFWQVECRALLSYAMKLLLHTDRANAVAVAAAIVVRADIAGIDEQLESEVVATRIERTRPIVAVATCIDEARAAA